MTTKLYAATGENGLFKVGITEQEGSRREYELRAAFLSRGSRLLSFKYLGDFKHADAIESHLCDALNSAGFEPMRGKEWFRNVNDEFFTKELEFARRVFSQRRVVIRGMEECEKKAKLERRARAKKFASTSLVSELAPETKVNEHRSYGISKADAVNYYKTARSLAKALGIAPNTVSEWIEVPGIHQIRLERLTRGILLAGEDAWGTAGVTPKGITI